MTALAETADGRWPLPPDLEPAWRNFVFTLFARVSPSTRMNSSSGSPPAAGAGNKRLK